MPQPQTGKICGKTTKIPTKPGSKHNRNAKVEVLAKQVTLSVSLLFYHENVLRPELAKNALAYFLDSKTGFAKREFYMFNKKMTLDHDQGFFSSRLDFLNQDIYFYGDSPELIEPYNSLLTELLAVAKQKVLQLHPNTAWNPDLCVINKYLSGEESTGWHSDKLTYIGPQPIIASISLGASREFLAKDLSSNVTVSTMLHHNSLVIMDQGFQENYKHSVGKVGKRRTNIHRNPISGDKRINITFRSCAITPLSIPQCPKCKTNKMTLRSRKTLQQNNQNLYFWRCAAFIDNSPCLGYKSYTP